MFSKVLEGLGWTLLSLIALLALLGGAIWILLDKAIDEFASREGVFFPSL